MYKFILQFIFASALTAYVSGECANACNGHGKCTSYDMCICNRNWQANDCSERVCQFGLAHVDTPKGDLDMSGDISGPGSPVADNSFVYPYGTVEQFPAMETTDLTTLDDTAHYYMECSNKGTCDRTSGDCICYPGYDGVACQRASCPNACSGHGVCKTKAQLAWGDNENVYKLWDKDAGMGCECDAGFSGPDCSLRQCKVGVDPLYLDDSATIKYSVFDFAVLTTAATADFTDGAPTGGTGYWAIRFYDSFGEDWLTTAIEAEADCDAVVEALESLPNNIIPSGTLYCTQTQNSDKAVAESVWEGTDAQKNGDTLTNHAYQITYNMNIWESSSIKFLGEISGDGTSDDVTDKSAETLSGSIYRLKFYGNPGALKQPEIELYLDGKNPSLASPFDDTDTIITKVWTDGQQGEYLDYFADHCDGVSVTVDANHKLYGLSDTEIGLLKACLGASDFDESNNVDVFNWDYGDANYPHIVKLVKSVSTSTEGGYYVALYFDGDDFQLLNTFSDPEVDGADAHTTTDVYEVYTTTGTFALTSNSSVVTTSFASNTIYTYNLAYDSLSDDGREDGFDGDISCEEGQNNAEKFEYIMHCLNKTDIFTYLNFADPAANPPYINLYTATRLYTEKSKSTVANLRDKNSFNGATDTANLEESHFLTHSISTNLATNWAVIPDSTAFGTAVGDVASDDMKGKSFKIYKFFPAVASTYEYVAECSNRGICQTDMGLCQCFHGYTSDDCSVQNSIAL